MMHVRVSLITADPPVLAGCLEYLQGEVRPVVESRPGSLGLSLLAAQESGLAILESFWATHNRELVWASRENEALLRAELARRTGRSVTAEDYQVAVPDPGPEQPPGGQPGLPEHPYRRLPPAACLLEARRHLPRPARPHGRRANRPNLRR
jgi:hypothetical protein